MKNIHRILSVLLGVVLLFGISACGGGGDSHSGDSQSKFEYYPMKTNIKTDGQFYQKDGIMFPASLWSVPEAERYDALDHGNVKGYFIDSLNNTKVFCYVGLPENASEENKVPAVVLVHGATGTAFYDWVEMWNNRGYAAIAMDTEGQMPTSSCTTMNPQVQASVREHGVKNTAFYDSASSVEEQWTYQALAAVFASTSFIGSFAEVDETKIGITGVSYGAYLTCLATAYDDRYLFAAPVYGCLANASSTFEFGSYYQNGNGSAVTLWDDETILQDNRTPFLFVSGLPDIAFGPDAVTRTAKQCKYAQTIFIPGLTHGHFQGAYIEEIVTFATEIFKNEGGLIRVTGDAAEEILTLKIPENVQIARVEMYYTLEETISPTTAWIEGNAELVDNIVLCSVDSSVKHSYIRILDSRGLYACSYVS